MIVNIRTLFSVTVEKKTSVVERYQGTADGDGMYSLLLDFLDALTVVTIKVSVDSLETL